MSLLTWCVAFLQQFMELEPEMLSTETIIPVYFAMEDDELLSIYTQTLTSSTSQGALSAAEGRGQFSSVAVYVNKCKLFSSERQANILILITFHCVLHSAASYGYSQRLSDGHQWGPEQSYQRLGHNQSGGRKLNSTPEIKSLDLI